MEEDRISDSTKKIYESKLRQVETIFQNASQLNSIIHADGKIDFALLTSDHVSEFFGHIASDLPQVQAYETVASYWSAIKQMEPS